MSASKKNKRIKVKSKKALLKRIKVSGAKKTADKVFMIVRAGLRHRMIGKTGEKKQRASKSSILSSVHKSLVKSIKK